MKSLFITYNGATEPLIQSQGVPYLKGLSKIGVSCILLSFEKHPGRDSTDYTAKARKLEKELRGQGIKWYRLRYHKRPSLLATLFDIVIGGLLGTYLAISKKVDIIHARATVPAAMGYMIAKLTGKKLLYDERGLTAEEYVDGGLWERKSLSYRLTHYFESKFLKKADGLVVLTDNIKGYLYSNGLRKAGIDVIPCCVDTKRFNIDSSSAKDLRAKYGLSDKFVILYAGSLGTWYMLDKMVDFFKAVKSVIKNAHFLLLSHAGRHIAERHFDSIGIPSGERTIECVAFDKMPVYIQMADVGIFFIKPVLSKRSSCPTKFAEYLSCGLPVVINAGIGDTDRIVEANRLGVVLKDLHRDSYLKALEKLSELLKEKQVLSDRCRRIAEACLSLEDGVKSYFNVYQKVLS